MATEYRLTLAGTTPVQEMAERALPDAQERPAGPGPMLSVGLYDRHGFAVTFVARQNGYMDAESDDGLWQWEPAAYVSVTFRMENGADPERSVTDMLTIVRRLLDTGPEDASFVLNGNWLLFTRIGGVVRKHRRDKWWTTYAFAAPLIPG